VFQILAVVLWVVLAAVIVGPHEFNVVGLLVTMVAPLLAIGWLVEARRSWWGPEIAELLADTARRRRYQAGMTIFCALVVALLFVIRVNG
jgi:hypothetical protein